MITNAMITLESVEQAELKSNLAAFIYDMISHAQRLETVITERDILGYIEAFEQGWHDGKPYKVAIQSGTHENALESTISEEPTRSTVHNSIVATDDVYDPLWWLNRSQAV